MTDLSGIPKVRLAECAQAILHSAVLGRIEREQDVEFLSSLIRLHPDAAVKVGCGIRHFEIRLSYFKTPSFWIVRSDGSETDFSYRSCLAPQTHRSHVLEALRRAIVGQVLDFKTRALRDNPYCSVTGQEVDDTCHVDHTPPFIELANEFVDSCGGFEAIEVTKLRDGKIGRDLASTEVSEKWCEFHKRHAKLTLLTAELNIKKGAGALGSRDLAALAIKLRKQFEFISGRWP